MELPTLYHNHIGICIGQGGVYPHVMMVEDPQNKLGVFALDLKPEQVMKKAVDTLIKEKPKQLMFGLDRYSKPNQGTTLGDLIGGLYWNGDGWRPFIIEYQDEPRIVKPLDWDNPYWKESLKREFLGFLKEVLGQTNGSRDFLL